MFRFTKSERAYWLENDQSGDRIRLGAKEVTEGFLEQFLGKGLAEMLMMCERFGKTIYDMELEKTMLRIERDEALRDLAAKTKEVEALRAQMDDARRERDALAAQRTSVTAQVRAVDEEPKKVKTRVDLMVEFVECVRAAEQDAMRGNHTASHLNTIKAVRMLADAAHVYDGGGK